MREEDFKKVLSICKGKPLYNYIGLSRQRVHKAQQDGMPEHIEKKFKRAVRMLIAELQSTLDDF